jgi:DNA polymerase
MPSLVRDYETRSLCDLAEVGAFRYASHASTSALCCAYAVDAGPVQLWLPGQPVPPEFIEAAANPDWTVEAFNDQFETAVETLNLAPRLGWPVVPLERHRCLQAQTLAHALPATLKGAAGALSLTHQKRDDGPMHRMCKPRRARKGEDPAGTYWFDDVEHTQALHSYCVGDVEAERELAGRLRPLCNREQKIWQLDAKINQRGIAIDRPLIEAASRIIDVALADIDRQIGELTDGVVVAASQVARLQRWSGLPSLGKEKIATALAGNKLTPLVRQVLQLRLEAAQSATKKVNTLLAWCDTDNRVRGTFRYHRASPGRWSGAGPQPQNLKKLNGLDIEPAIEVIATGDYRRVKEKFGNPLALIGQCLRPMFVAAPRHRLIGADFAGIEARVLSWLAGETWKLEAFEAEDRGGPSVYCVTAGRIYGRDPKTITKDSPEREVGKRCELAFGYAGGLGAWRKFEKFGTATGFSDSQVENFKMAWRRANPATVRFWERLNTAAIIAVRTPGKIAEAGPVAFRREDEFLFLRLPSGRKVAYPFPKVIVTGRGGYAVSFKDASEGQWRDCRYGHGAYGGLWCENVVQAVARDLLAEALYRLENSGYPIVLHCHDEAVAEVAQGQGSTAEFSEIMTTLPRWATGLPIAAESWESGRYIK